MAPSSIPRAWLGALALGLAMALPCASPTRACTFDGAPTLLVDGRLVTGSAAPTSAAQVAKWAPFTAPSSYPAGQPVALREPRDRVLRALPPGADAHPWRWRFGDGTRGAGFAVRHAYRHAGTYEISVWAYVSAGRDSGWYQFDAATIRVR